MMILGVIFLMVVMVMMSLGLLIMRATARELRD